MVLQPRCPRAAHQPGMEGVEERAAPEARILNISSSPKRKIFLLTRSLCDPFSVGRSLLAFLGDLQRTRIHQTQATLHGDCEVATDVAQQESPCHRHAGAFHQPREAARAADAGDDFSKLQTNRIAMSPIVVRNGMDI